MSVVKNIVYYDPSLVHKHNDCVFLHLQGTLKARRILAANPASRGSSEEVDREWDSSHPTRSSSQDDRKPRFRTSRNTERTFEPSGRGKMVAAVEIKEVRKEREDSVLW